MNKLRFLSDTLNKSHGIRPNYTARANFEMHGNFFMETHVTFGDSNNTVQKIMHFILLLFGKQKKQPLSIAATCATTLIKRKKTRGLTRHNPLCVQKIRSRHLQDFENLHNNIIIKKHSPKNSISIRQQ
jgi:hypothetical protein